MSPTHNINGYIFIVNRCSRLITIIFTFDLISSYHYHVTKSMKLFVEYPAYLDDAHTRMFVRNYTRELIDYYIFLETPFLSWHINPSVGFNEDCISDLLINFVPKR